MTAAADLGPVVACPACRHGARLHGDVGCVRGDCECSLTRADVDAPGADEAGPADAPSGRTLDLLDPPCVRCQHRRGRHAQSGSCAPCLRCSCRDFTKEAVDAPVAPQAEPTAPPVAAAPAPAAPAAEARDVAEAPRPGRPALKTPRRTDPRPAVPAALAVPAVVGGGDAVEEVAAAVGRAATALDSLGAFVAELHERAYYLAERWYCPTCAQWGAGEGPCPTCTAPMQPIYLATVPREVTA